MHTLTSRIVLLGAVIAVAAAGCKVGTGHPAAATNSAAATPAATTSASAMGARLVEVHDPGHVTGVAPATCHALPGPRPDPACTPGAIDPAITQANIQSTICRAGYTATVRPPDAQTETLKHSMYKSYGIRTGTTSELDHMVSLELGGSNDAANLWPEIGSLPNPKDAVENDLHRAVCSGKVTLVAAQHAIASNWQTAESVLGISH